MAGRIVCIRGPTLASQQKHRRCLRQSGLKESGMGLLWTAPRDTPRCCGFAGLLACAVTVVTSAQSSQVREIMVAWVADVVNLKMLDTPAECAVGGDRPAAGLVSSQYGLHAGRPVDRTWCATPLPCRFYAVARVDSNSARHSPSALALAAVAVAVGLVVLLRPRPHARRFLQHSGTESVDLPTRRQEPTDLSLAPRECSGRLGLDLGGAGTMGPVVQKAASCCGCLRAALFGGHSSPSSRSARSLL